MLINVTQGELYTGHNAPTGVGVFHAIPVREESRYVDVRSLGCPATGGAPKEQEQQAGEWKPTWPEHVDRVGCKTILNVNSAYRGRELGAKLWVVNGSGWFRVSQGCRGKAAPSGCVLFSTFYLCLLALACNFTGQVEQG